MRDGGSGCRKKKQRRPREQNAQEKPLPPLLAQIGGKGLFNPQKMNFLDEPHHTRITKVEQIQSDDDIKANADKG